jgi:hypothetical protein
MEPDAEAAGVEAIINRAQKFGHRMLFVNGGQQDPVYLVTYLSADSDFDRGVRSSLSAEVDELNPRPIIKPVTTQQITEFGSLLQAGDYSLEVASYVISEEELTTVNARIKVGGSDIDSNDGQLFRIVKCQPSNVSGSISYYTLFVRGMK